MNKLKGFFRKYDLALFFLLNYLLTWWPAPIRNGQIIPYGPTLAAVIVLAMASGRAGLAGWWRRLAQRPRAWVWLLAGPALIIGYQGAAFLINLFLGARVSAPLALPSTGILLELLLIGGMWEEPGWTGYALTKLQERFADRPGGNLKAALTLGVFRAIWHLPLYLYGHIYWFDVLLFEIAIQVIIAWLYNRSGGSVLVVIIFHFASNYLGAVLSPAFTDGARTTYYALFMGLAAVIAVLLAVFGGPWTQEARIEGKRLEEN